MLSAVNERKTHENLRLKTGCEGLDVGHLIALKNCTSQIAYKTMFHMFPQFAPIFTPKIT